MKRFINRPMTAPFGWGLLISKSTAMFAGSRTPSAITAMTPTTMNDAISQGWLGFELARLPYFRATWKPAANVMSTSVGMSSTILGMNRAMNSARAGIDKRPMIGPTTRPTKRSMAVHSAPPATWLNMSAQVQLPAIATITKMTTAPTMGNPFNGTIWIGRCSVWGTGASLSNVASAKCSPPTRSPKLERALRLPLASSRTLRHRSLPRLPPQRRGRYPTTSTLERSGSRLSPSLCPLTGPVRAAFFTKALHIRGVSCHGEEVVGHLHQHAHAHLFPRPLEQRLGGHQGAKRRLGDLASQVFHRLFEPFAGNHLVHQAILERILGAERLGRVEVARSPLPVHEDIRLDHGLTTG